MPDPVEPDLAELAAGHGVAVRYTDADDQVVDVDRAVVVDVLAALDVDASTPPALAAALDRVHAAADAAAVPPTLVLDAGEQATIPGPGRLTLEDGTGRDVDGVLPGDLPTGYHHLDAGGRAATVIVAPPALDPPPRTWGWSAQLYALRSAGSWGCGDYADLGVLLERSANEHGAGALLVNPLHALALAPRVEPSPYSPSSRRFLHPLYLRVTDTTAYGAAPAEVRAEVDALRPPGGDLVDHDAVWAAKDAALAAAAPVRPVGADRRSPTSTTSAATSPPGTRWPSGTVPTSPSGRPGSRTPARPRWPRLATRSPTVSCSTPGASTSPSPSSPPPIGGPTGWAWA